jgi:hypothetical protein
LNSQDDAGVLTVVQSLALHYLPFDEFQRIFEPILLDLKKNYKAIKIEELSRISEERSSSDQNNLMLEERDIPCEQLVSELPNQLVEPKLN